MEYESTTNWKSLEKEGQIHLAVNDIRNEIEHNLFLVSNQLLPTKMLTRNEVSLIVTMAEKARGYAVMDPFLTIAEDFVCLIYSYKEITSKVLSEYKEIAKKLSLEMEKIKDT